MINENEMLASLQKFICETVDKLEKSSVGSVSLKIGKYGDIENIEIKVKKQDVMLAQGGINLTTAANETTEIKAQSVSVQTQTKTEMKTPSSGSGETERGYSVRSPLIGIVYCSPSPDAEPYIKVGQKVKKGDILCIIEAMKVMNEIESDRDGTVAEIMMKNGEMAQFGDILAIIE